MSHLFELLVELIEILEPYLLFTTIFIIPSTIALTSLPKHFFKFKTTQYLFSDWFETYERNKTALERLNSMTQMAMCVILVVDLFGFVEFFLGPHKAEHSDTHVEAAHGTEAVAKDFAEESEPAQH
jgi:fucose 4-O-acetylase-like acetyltransferase